VKEGGEKKKYSRGSLFTVEFLREVAMGCKEKYKKV
jgi:hypothetical protein